MEKSNFSVNTVTILSEDGPMYCHWAEGLTMYITKDGITMKLNSEEIQQLVKSLPSTVGGRY